MRVTPSVTVNGIDASLFKAMQEADNAEVVSITASEFKQRFQELAQKAITLNEGAKEMYVQFDERYRAWEATQVEELAALVRPLIAAARRYRRHERFHHLRKVRDGLTIDIFARKHWWSRKTREVFPDRYAQEKMTKQFLQEERRRVSLDICLAAKEVVHREAHLEANRLYYRTGADYGAIYGSGMPEHLSLASLNLTDRFRTLRWVSDRTTMINHSLSSPFSLLTHLTRALQVAAGLSDDVVLHFPISAMESFLDLDAGLCEHFRSYLRWMHDRVLEFTPSEPLNYPASVISLMQTPILTQE
jgi:hypothetical protein